MLKTCKRCNQKFETNNKHRGRCNDCMNRNMIVDQIERPNQQKSNGFKGGKIGWYEEEWDIIRKMFHENKSYEEIAEVINNNRREKSTTNFVPHRSARAVAFQAQKIGLITKERLEKEDRQNTLRRQIERREGLYKIKKKVFNRDNNECAYCGSTKSPEFVHIIPFNSSRKNKEEEAITLCHRHHKIFDGYKQDIKDQELLCRTRIEITKIIFNKMCSYYPNYSKNYEMYNHYCSSCGVHCGIEKRKIEKVYLEVKK